MKTLSVPAFECLYYDYSQAAAFFKELGCNNPPQLGTLIYENAKGKIATVGWCSEEDNCYQDVPAFASFEDNDQYDTVTFVPMDEHEVFIIDDGLYMTVAVSGGLGIRRINMLFDESIVNALNIIRGLPEMKYQLCKIFEKKQKRNFLGYYWKGTWDEASAAQTPTRVFVPVFGDNENIFTTHNISELEIVAAQPQETFVKNATLWLVSSDQQYGTSIVPLMDIPDSNSDNRQLLN